MVVRPKAVQTMLLGAPPGLPSPPAPPSLPVPMAIPWPSPHAPPSVPVPIAIPWPLAVPNLRQALEARHPSSYALGTLGASEAPGLGEWEGTVDISYSLCKARSRPHIPHATPGASKRFQSRRVSPATVCKFGTRGLTCLAPSDGS
jgi:hypothetical protein